MISLASSRLLMISLAGSVSALASSRLLMISLASSRLLMISLAGSGSALASSRLLMISLAASASALASSRLMISALALGLINLLVYFLLASSHLLASFLAMIMTFLPATWVRDREREETRQDIIKNKQLMESW